MAVLKMKRICICALKKERKQLLEFLQRRGVIEINSVIPEDSVFQKNDISKNNSIFIKNIATTKEALEILEEYSPEKKPFLGALMGRKEINVDQYQIFSSEYDDILKNANRITKLAKDIAENKAEILKLEVQAEMLIPWRSLDIPVNFKGTRYTSAFIGTLPGEWSMEEIYAQLAELTPLNVDLISVSKEQTCIFVVCEKKKEEEVSNQLRSIGFSYPGSSFDRTPSQQRQEIQEQINVARMAIFTAQEEIESYGDRREKLKFLQDYETMRAEKYQVIDQVVQSNRVMVLTGYIPEKEGHKLEEELNHRFQVAVEFEDPSDEEDVPVLLKNNGFSAPLEGTIESFSLPGKGELDPTMVMSLFYYLLFGLMLSDAGYGLIMVLGCGFALAKFRKTLEPSMRNTLKMYLYCGISTIFWGVMFATYFGDLIDVTRSTFFGITDAIPPVWFLPVSEPMRMLVFSMALGIIHIFAGLMMKLYQSMKQKDYQSVLYDVVFWIVLLTSSILILLNTQMIKDILKIDIKISSTMLMIANIAALIFAIGIILTNGRESKNPFKRVLKGAYALYGISGYLSDVLSYSRLLALGLATGIIGSVINTMAAMAAGGVFGVVFFVIIVIFGHTLNLGINALGAYVHTNRLQYVEFFGKFYEGGGRKFHPFQARTKYFKFKENVKNG